MSLSACNIMSYGQNCSAKKHAIQVQQRALQQNQSKLAWENCLELLSSWVLQWRQCGIASSYLLDNGAALLNISHHLFCHWTLLQEDDTVNSMHNLSAPHRTVCHVITTLSALSTARITDMGIIAVLDLTLQRLILAITFAGDCIASSANLNMSEELLPQRGSCTVMTRRGW